MKKYGLLWIGFLLLSGAYAWGQSGLDKVCEVNVSSPKPGASKQFEEGRKKHNQFHVDAKDKDAIEVWQISTGPYTGSYLTAVCGLTWKGMDGHEAMDQRDETDIAVNLAPAIGSNQTSYYVLRTDLSKAPQASPNTKMITVVHFFVKPGSISQFTDSIKRINSAMTSSKYPAKPSRWYVLANGGEGPHYVLVTDRTSWADMQGPDESMSDMLQKVYGNDDKTLDKLRESIDHTMSELLTYRADLSYTPAK